MIMPVQSEYKSIGLNLLPGMPSWNFSSKNATEKQNIIVRNADFFLSRPEFKKARNIRKPKPKYSMTCKEYLLGSYSSILETKGMYERDDR